MLRPKLKEKLMTKANITQSPIAHAFQSLAAELDPLNEAERAAYLARVTLILAQEMNNPALFTVVLQRAKGTS